MTKYFLIILSKTRSTTQETVKWLISTAQESVLPDELESNMKLTKNKTKTSYGSDTITRPNHSCLSLQFRKKKLRLIGKITLICKSLDPRANAYFCLIL